MKKLIYLTAVAGSLLLTTSCVDLTQEPESFITEEEYWNTVDQASLEKAADALYSDLWQGNYGFNSRLQRINVCADDITYRAAKANNELAYYSRLTPNLTANDADFSTTWTLFYKVISSSNKIIKGTTIPTNEKELYPRVEYLSRMREMNIPVMVNSDCHYPDLVNDGRKEVFELLKQAGFKSTRELVKGKWQDIAL
jgi:hypothetical protein